MPFILCRLVLFFVFVFILTVAGTKKVIKSVESTLKLISSISQKTFLNPTICSELVSSLTATAGYPTPTVLPLTASIFAVLLGL